MKKLKRFFGAFLALVMVFSIMPAIPAKAATYSQYYKITLSADDTVQNVPDFISVASGTDLYAALTDLGISTTDGSEVAFIRDDGVAVYTGDTVTSDMTITVTKEVNIATNKSLYSNPYVSINLKYDLTNTGKLTIKGTSRNGAYAIFDGISSSDSKKVRTVEFADTVTETILDSYFSGCKNLVEVKNFPSNISSAQNMFNGCTSLTTMPKIPDSLSNMYGMFYGCTNLRALNNIPASVENLREAFYECTSLATIPVIPDSVSDMSGAFFGCTALTTAPTIPNSVTNMSITFNGCTALTGPILIKANPTSYVGALTNAGTSGAGITINYGGKCTQEIAEAIVATGDSNYVKLGMELITVAKTQIGTTGVYWQIDAGGILKITGTGDPAINASDFDKVPWYVYRDYITSVEIAETVKPTDISHWFRSMNKLTRVNLIPDSVVKMSYAFAYSNSIAELPDIPEGVEDILFAFTGCPITEAPELPSTIKQAYWAFANCTSLKSAPELPDGISSIGGMFWGCSSLEHPVDIPSSVTSMVQLYYNCASLSGSFILNVDGNIRDENGEITGSFANNISGVLEGAGTNGDGITVNWGAKGTREFAEAIVATGNPDYVTLGTGSYVVTINADSSVSGGPLTNRKVSVSDGANLFDTIDSAGLSVPNGYTIVIKDKDGNNLDVDKSTKVVKDITVSVSTKKNTYTIKYELNGGSLATANPSTYTVETATFTLNNPTKTGYTFTGWTGSIGPTPQLNVTIAKGTTGDKSYTANWTANTNTKYVVNHWKQNLNGNAATHDATNYTLADTDNLTGTTGASVTPDTKSYMGFTAPSTQTVTVAADGTAVVNYYYTRNKYTVTLNKGKGIDSVTGAGTYLYEQEVTIDMTVGSAYEWSGWTGDDSVATKAYTFDMPADSVSYKANATRVIFDISYELRNGTLNDPITSYSKYADSFSLPLPTRKGYTFLGWTGSNGETPETVVTIETGSTGDKEYTANWKPVTYSISYDLAGGAVDSNPESYTVESDDIVLNVPTKDGYVFTGWTGSNGEKPQTNVSIEKGSTGNKSYTANWVAAEYAIDYDLDGGSEDTNPTSYTIDSDDITLNAPTKFGYTFIGWTGSNGETPELEITITTGSIGAKSYKANWEKYEAPVITKQPLSKTVGINDAVTFSIEATGTKNKYQWYVADNKIAEGTKISGATEASYVLDPENITYELSNKYFYCIVSNDGNEAVVSDRALLVVASRPNAPTFYLNLTANSWANSALDIQLIGSYINGDNTNVGYKYSLDAGLTWKTYNGSFVWDLDTVQTTLLAKAYNKTYPEVESDNSSFVVHYDATAPIVTSVNYYNSSKTMEIEAVDATSGVAAYGISKSADSEPTEWTEDNEFTIVETGRYYAWARDEADNTVCATGAPLDVVIDVDSPTVKISCAAGLAASKDVTLAFSDNVGVTKYYFGKVEPTADTTFVDTTETKVVIPVTDAGTYYVVAMDAEGNKSVVQSVELFSVAFNSGVTTVDSVSGLAYKGENVVIPTMSRSGYTFEGFKSGDTVLEGKSILVDSNKAYTAIWEKVEEKEDKPATPIVSETPETPEKPNTNDTPAPIIMKNQAVTGVKNYTKILGAKPFSIKPKTSGNGKLTYKSSNTKVAKVSSSGKISITGVGTAKITIKASKTTTFNAASKTITIKVIPKAVSLKSVKSSAKKALSLSWARNKNVTGYQIQYATNKKFTKAKTLTIKSNKVTSRTIKALKSDTKYYVRIRTYKTVSGKKYYSNWSKSKNQKVK